MKTRTIKSIYNELKKYSKIHYKAGIENRQDRPYWKWDTVFDCRSCETCKGLHGKVFMWNDPIWTDYLPPVHLTCRCGVRTLTNAAFIEKGLEVSKGSDYYHLIEAINDIGGIK